MDLNQLYFDYQVLRMQADRARSPETRQLNNRDAALLAGRIRGRQLALGANAAGGWSDIAANDPAGSGYPRGASDTGR